MVVQLSVIELRQLIAEEIAAALENGSGRAPEKDRLLSPEEAAEILGQDVRWLYRHANELPLRAVSVEKYSFFRIGLRRWIAAKGRIRGVDPPTRTNN